jgi:hypothetical protein
MTYDQQARNMLDLEQLLERGEALGGDVDVNLVEIHYGTATSDCTIDVSQKATNLGEIMGQSGITTNIVELHHKDMTYVYDKSCDGQKVLRKIPLAYEQDGKWHAFVYHEETLPGHRFPCTNDVDAKHVFVRTTYKFNNRMHVIKDALPDGKSVVYVQYRHASMVDIKKMTSDAMRLMQRLKQLQ